MVTLLQKPSTLQPCLSGLTLHPEDDVTKRNEDYVPNPLVISNAIPNQSHDKVVSCKSDCSGKSKVETRTEAEISVNVINAKSDIKESDISEPVVLKGKTKDFSKRNLSLARKPFKCKFCEFEFTKLSAAKTHVEINHLVTIQ